MHAASMFEPPSMASPMGAALLQVVYARLDVVLGASPLGPLTALPEGFFHRRHVFFLPIMPPEAEKAPDFVKVTAGSPDPNPQSWGAAEGARALFRMHRPTCQPLSLLSSSFSLFFLLSPRMHRPTTYHTQPERGGARAAVVEHGRGGAWPEEGERDDGFLKVLRALCDAARTVETGHSSRSRLPWALLASWHSSRSRPARSSRSRPPPTTCLPATPSCTRSAACSPRSGPSPGAPPRRRLEAGWLGDCGPGAGGARRGGGSRARPGPSRRRFRHGQTTSPLQTNSIQNMFKYFL